MTVIDSLIQQILKQILTFDATPYFYGLIAFFIGCVAATAELLSRYSEGPVKTLKNVASYWYLGLNGVISLIAYAIIKQSGITFGPFGSIPVNQAVLAGFSAMAVLRSSVANIKDGQETRQIGLAPIMQIFLNAVDRDFDRKRSQVQIMTVSEIMKDVDFNKAAKDLPLTCLNLMQNTTKEERERMGVGVADLAKGEYTPKAKAVNLGIIISRVTGPELLQTAVDSAGDAIRTPSSGAPVDEPMTPGEDRIKALKKKFI